MIWQNGQLVAQGSQFEGLDEVEVVVATVSLEDVRSTRANFISRSFQAAAALPIPRIPVEIQLCPDEQLGMVCSVPFEPAIASPMEEIAYGPSGWLWDYLRRSGQRGGANDE